MPSAAVNIQKHKSQEALSIWAADQTPGLNFGQMLELLLENQVRILQADGVRHGQEMIAHTRGRGHAGVCETAQSPQNVAQMMLHPSRQMSHPRQRLHQPCRKSLEKSLKSSKKFYFLIFDHVATFHMVKEHTFFFY